MGFGGRRQERGPPELSPQRELKPKWLQHTAAPALGTERGSAALQDTDGKRLLSALVHHMHVRRRGAKLLGSAGHQVLLDRVQAAACTACPRLGLLGTPVEHQGLTSPEGQLLLQNTSVIVHAADPHLWCACWPGKDPCHWSQITTTTRGQAPQTCPQAVMGLERSAEGHKALKCWGREHGWQR